MKVHALFTCVALGLTPLAGCAPSPADLSTAPPVIDSPAKRRADAAERAQLDKKVAHSKAKTDAAMAAKRERDDAEARRDQLVNGTVDPALPRRALNEMTADRQKQESQQQSGAVAEQRP